MSDPVWLPDVLRAAGLRCDVFPGAFERGHGDFGNIWGVVCHHTGSFGETPNGIANHPELGLASQLFLHRDGYYVLCGVGVAWHAGQGSWPGLPTNGANQFTIGIEAQNDGGGVPGKPHHIPWPDVQYNAYVRGVAAILNHLGQDASHAIGHKEWAGAAQGKWDPGGIDMKIFRDDVRRVQAELRGGQNDSVEATVATNQEKFDRIYFELTNKFPSRSKYRADDKGVDTAVGFLLNVDAMSHEALIERNALLGNAEAKALVKREADKGDKWAQLVLSKCP